MQGDQTLSYAQRFEDLHLLRVFGAQERGFYIDVGAGHPVHDNVSYAFYLKGWSGITVEPNPWLDELSAALRPRDRRMRMLLGEAAGEATYYLVEDFHGLSTTVEGHAQAALAQYGKAAKAMTVPVATLASLCEAHAPAAIDFLKIDVEGAEKQVLAGNAWSRFRPKVVVLEALAPVTLAPAWDGWEALLLAQGYGFAFFDGLNRYYVAAEHAALAERLADAPASFEGVVPLRSLGPALEDRSHPDHRLARLLAAADMVRLPLLDAETLLGLLTADLDPAELSRTPSAADAAAVGERLFGPGLEIVLLPLRRNATIRDLYAAAIASEPFRAACGRISASFAW